MLDAKAQGKTTHDSMPELASPSLPGLEAIQAPFLSPLDLNALIIESHGYTNIATIDGILRPPNVEHGNVGILHTRNREDAGALPAKCFFRPQPVLRIDTNTGILQFCPGTQNRIRNR